MKEMGDSLRKQAGILGSLAERFQGQYAWIEKAGLHASEVSMIMGESVRRMRLAAEENERLKKENEDLKLIVSTLQTAAQKAIDAWEKTKRHIGIDDGEGMGG